MLVAVFVCRAEGILERRRAAMGQINVGREENRCFLGRRFKPQSARLSGRLQWRSIVPRVLKESRFVKKKQPKKPDKAETAAAETEKHLSYSDFYSADLCFDPSTSCLVRCQPDNSPSR